MQGLMKANEQSLGWMASVKSDAPASGQRATRRSSANASELNKDLTRKLVKDAEKTLKNLKCVRPVAA
jgi:hypothetical protein